jgi:hypothetical protein
VVLLVVGLALWIAPDSIAQLVWNSPLGYIPYYEITADQTRELGNQLVGGAAVAFAVLIAEVFITRRIQQENERENERRNLQLTLSATQNLSGADLQGRRLRGFFLPAKDFTGASLQNVDLTGANLAGCDFRDANLEGANLLAAELLRANLEGANLKGVTGLREKQIAAAFGDEYTELPKGFNRQMMRIQSHGKQTGENE